RRRTKRAVPSPRIPLSRRKSSHGGMMKLRRARGMLVGAAALVGCGSQGAAPAPGTSVEAAVQQLRSGRGASGNAQLGMDILVTDENGTSLPCEPDAMKVTVTATSLD